MEMEEYWTKEEFEDRLTRAMIAVYDYHWNFEFPENELRPAHRLLPQEWSYIKQKGLYFLPGDRYMDPNGLDLCNDGMPDYALLTIPVDITKEKAESENVIHDYLRVGVVRKIKKIPPPYTLTAFGIAKYMIYFISCKVEGGCVFAKRPVIISQEGKIIPCDEIAWNGVKLVRESLEKVEPDEFKVITMGGSLIFSGWADRRYLWNVAATDGNQKAMFGVYPSQIKSLFYCRKEPLSNTGRLRPILHWVRSHRRRLKKGIDIDIEKHLRGTNKFVMDGYEFNIERPIKGEKTH
jgi:hypothetical protein